MSEQISIAGATPAASAFTARPTNSTNAMKSPPAAKLSLYFASLAAAFLLPALSTNAQLPTLDVSKQASQSPSAKKADSASDDDGGDRKSVV